MSSVGQCGDTGGDSSVEIHTVTGDRAALHSQQHNIAMVQFLSRTAAMSETLI
jgi:hypothetical protein